MLSPKFLKKYIINKTNTKNRNRYINSIHRFNFIKSLVKSFLFTFLPVSIVLFSPSSLFQLVINKTIKPINGVVKKDNKK